MKRLLLPIAALAFISTVAAQDSQPLGDVARQNQEQKKAKHTITNDDVSSGTMTTEPTAPAAQTTTADSTANTSSVQTQTADNTSAASDTKPDRSNFVGDAPGDTPEPKDRIETLKKHAGQWDNVVANLEKKIAAEKDSEKRDSLELMLEHARQNQAKDAAEQKDLEKSEAEKANAQPEGAASQEQQQGAQPQ